MTAPMPSFDRTVPPTDICPFCRSTQVTTASKIVSENSYWRCLGCGQIWNPARLVTQPARRW